MTNAVDVVNRAAPLDMRILGNDQTHIAQAIRRAHATNAALHAPLNEDVGRALHVYRAAASRIVKAHVRYLEQRSIYAVLVMDSRGSTRIPKSHVDAAANGLTTIGTLTVSSFDV